MKGYQGFFNFVVTAALAAVAVVAFVAYLCATAPLPVLPSPETTAAALPDAPLVIDMEAVRGASSADWTSLTDVVLRDVSVNTNRPITLSLQSWDFCSECDSQAPVIAPPAPAEPISVTFNLNVELSGTVKLEVPVPNPVEDLCKEFYLTGPDEVAAGQWFSVTAYLPSGFEGKLVVTPYNLTAKTFLKDLAGNDNYVVASFQAPNTGLPEIWLPIAAALINERGTGVCTEFTLVRDP